MHVSKSAERLDRMANTHQTCGMGIDVTQGDRTLSDRVAEELRALMARKRISGAEMARRLQVSPMWVSYRLAGRQEIGLTDLERMARILDVEPVDLLAGAAVPSAGNKPPYVAGTVRPPDRRPKGRADSRNSDRRSQLKRALTPEEKSLIAG